MGLPRVHQLTHSQENMLDLHWLESSEAHPDELEVVARSLATHLRHLLDQRNVHLEVHVQLPTGFLPGSLYLHQSAGG